MFLEPSSIHIPDPRIRDGIARIRVFSSISWTQYSDWDSTGFSRLLPPRIPSETTGKFMGKNPMVSLKDPRRWQATETIINDPVSDGIFPLTSMSIPTSWNRSDLTSFVHTETVNTYRIHFQKSSDLILG